jgi:DNA repair photolyase
MEVLRKELGRVRVPQAELWPDAGSPARGFILLGDGVSDSYQAAEARSGLARKTLELLEELSLPVHVLTKSCCGMRTFWSASRAVPALL